jgi:uncharacterized membrane protein
MDQGITFLILVIIAMLGIPLIIAVRINNKLSNLFNELNDIKGMLANLNRNKSTAEKGMQYDEIKAEEREISKPAHRTFTQHDLPKAIPIEEKPIIETPKVATVTIPQEYIVVATEETDIIENIPAVEKPTAKVFVEKPIEVVTNNHSFNLEQFIGEKLISIVGIAILVLGIFFSVKWAIDKELITNTGKVMIGLISGTILIAVAHRLIKNYRAFSSILVGGGLAVYYFSIYSAFQTYHLIGQIPAFVIMIGITILGAVLANIYDKKELAIIALLGGFCTPFFLSTGAGNYKILFTYISILNMGMFVLAYKKNWKLLNSIAYFATYIIFLTWLATKYNGTNAQSIGAFVFATIFYFLFFGANIIYNIKHGTKLAAQEVSLLLSNACIYFGVGMMCLHSFEPQNFKGIFTMSLAILNFSFAYLFYKNNRIDKNIIYLLIGLVLTFVSITAPIQLHGNYITLFWASEMIILYVIGNKTKLSVLKNTSIGILIITMISLLMDWQNNYYSLHVNAMPIIFNKAFVTSLVVMAAIFIKQKLLSQEKETHLLYSQLPTTLYATILSILLLVLGNLAGLIELHYHCHRLLVDSPLGIVLCWVYEFVFMAILLTYCTVKNNTTWLKSIVIFSSMLLLLYPIANYSVGHLHQFYLMGQHTKGSLLLYILLPITALYLLWMVLKFAIPYYKNKAQYFKFILWLGTLLGLYIISTWSVHIWTQINFAQGFDIDAIRTKGSKVVLPILWSVVSLILMLQGMRHKIAHLRIIALTIFAATILKLFVYDISNMGQGAKIAAFVILGIILLLVSFMYQKIKNLFTDNSTNDEA